MKRVRIQWPKARRRHRSLEVLALDPRDPDIARAKLAARRVGGGAQPYRDCERPDFRAVVDRLGAWER
jgi:hypothetical protein